MGCPLPSELRKLMENRIFEPPLFYQALPRLHWQPDNTAGQTVSSDIFLCEPNVTVNNNYMSCEGFHFHCSDFDPSVVHIPKPVARSSSALNLFSLPFLDCAVHTEEDRGLNIEVYRKPTHTDQYSLLDSHHPLKHKMGFIRTLNYQAEAVPTGKEGKEKEQKHIRGALKTCGYQNWTFVKTSNRSRADREEETGKHNNILIP